MGGWLDGCTAKVISWWTTGVERNGGEGEGGGEVWGEVSRQPMQGGGGGGERERGGTTQEY